MNTIDKEIINLKRELLNMFLMVESQWEKGTTALLEYDQDIAEEIQITENRINAQELKIDRYCENIIALHSPVAIDLRFVLSAYKINHALERVADISQGIAEYVAESDEKYPQIIINELKLPEMLQQFNFMMDDVVEAFENEDSKVARKLFKKDKILNKINAEASDVIIKNIENYNSNMLLYLLATVRKIERAGDSIKKIAEEIIFHIDAKIVKHKNKS